MSIKVNDGRSESDTVILSGGKLQYAGLVDTVGLKYGIGIGCVHRVGNGELRDVIGGQVNAHDVELILRALLFSDGRGDVEGIDGVELVGLTLDTATISFTRGSDGPTDTLTFAGPDLEALVESLDRRANLNDAKSRFSIIDTGDNLGGKLGPANAIIGTKPIRDLIGGQLNIHRDGGSSDIAAILDAALDGDPRLKLLGLEDDSFTVQVFNTVKRTTDTLLFRGADVEKVISELPPELVFSESGPITLDGTLSTAEALIVQNEAAFQSSSVTVALTFSMDTLRNGSFTQEGVNLGRQLVAKDHVNLGDGAHTQLGVNKAGQLVVRYQGSDANGQQVVLASAANVIEARQEYDVALVLDGYRDDVILFVDGVEVARADTEGLDVNGWAPNDEALVFGAGTALAAAGAADPRLSNEIDGTISDIFVFDGALSQSAIELL